MVVIVGASSFPGVAEAGVFEMFWREGFLAYDAVKGIDWTWLSLDGAMAKARSVRDKAGPDPTDRGKKGVKRSVPTDGRGTPIGAAIAGANRNDHLLMRETLDGMRIERPRPTRRRPQHLCPDEGYDDADPRRLAAERGFTLRLRTRGEEIRAKRHRNGKARRWVVEASHSWTNRFRDLLIRWGKKPETYLALLHFAFGTVAWRQCLPG